MDRHTIQNEAGYLFMEGKGEGEKNGEAGRGRGRERETERRERREERPKLPLQEGVGKERLRMQARRKTCLPQHIGEGWV